jgi:dTDP-4-dehydrorhamnose 3,5-epimerase-like enzyme
MIITQPSLVPLSQFRDNSGVLTVVQEDAESPLTFKRVYWLHGLTVESQRGAHAHRTLSQLIIAISGQFRVQLTGRTGEETFLLGDPSTGLFVPPGYWRNLDRFSNGATCLVLASDVYDEHDYIRDWQEFEEWIGPAS